MGSHKTKDQLEIELNELKQLYGEKCSECDFLTKDNRAKSEAVTNACADLKNKGKDLEDARAELKALKEGNKKLADQFYAYRSELVKVRNDLAGAIEKRDSLKVELEGVRGALKRESDLRVDTEKKRDEYKQEMVKWKDASEDYQNRWHSAWKGNERLRNELNEVEEIQRKHNKLTLESLDNALRQWEYIDNKLSHDLSMPLESLIQLLDEYDVNDFCKLRDRLMFGPLDDYSNAIANVKKLEKENLDLKAVADDLEKQRRVLEQKLSQEQNVAMVQEARATDLEGQLRRKTNDCGEWMDRAFRDEKELRKVKEHDRMAQENFEKAARKNDELQNEVNKLRQRWTDEFNPEDEMLGRKVLEWQDINVVLAKHNIENSMVLGAELDTLKEYRKVLDKHSSATHGAIGAGLLDKLLSDRETDVFGYPVADWKRVLDENSVDCPGKLAAFLEGFEKYRRVVRNHGITNGQPGLDERLEKLEGLDKVCKEHDIESWFDLQKRLDEIEDLRRQSCPEEYMKVFSEYGIDSAEKLADILKKWRNIRQCSSILKNNMPYLGNITDLIKELA